MRRSKRTVAMAALLILPVGFLSGTTASASNVVDDDNSVVFYTTNEMTFDDAVAYNKWANPDEADKIDAIVANLEDLSDSGTEVFVPHDGEEVDLTLAVGSNRGTDEPLIGTAEWVATWDTDPVDTNPSEKLAERASQDGLRALTWYPKIEPRNWAQAGYGMPTNATRYTYWTGVEIGVRAWLLPEDGGERVLMQEISFIWTVDPGTKTHRITHSGHKNGPGVGFLTAETSYNYTTCGNRAGACGRSQNTMRDGTTPLTGELSVANVRTLQGVTVSAVDLRGVRVYTKLKTGTANCDDTNCYYAP